MKTRPPSVTQVGSGCVEFYYLASVTSDKLLIASYCIITKVNCGKNSVFGLNILLCGI